MWLNIKSWILIVFRHKICTNSKFITRNSATAGNQNVSMTLIIRILLSFSELLAVAKSVSDLLVHGTTAVILEQAKKFNIVSDRRRKWTAIEEVLKIKSPAIQLKIKIYSDLTYLWNDHDTEVSFFTVNLEAFGRSFWIHSFDKKIVQNYQRVGFYLIPLLLTWYILNVF